MSYRRLLFVIPVLVLLLPLSVAFADDDFDVTLSTEVYCDVVDFTINVANDNGPFTLSINFGDSEEFTTEVESFPPENVTHPYPVHGEYEVLIKVVDADGLEGELEQTLFIDGPVVTLNSSSVPPFTLEAGEATVDFFAVVEGGDGSYEFSWDLDDDGAPDAVDDPAFDTASHTYTEGGKYKAKVTVTDGCGFSDTDKLTVVILDPDSEALCHPMAYKISEGLKDLLPGQTLEDYSCEDIFNFFIGGYPGSQLGSQLGFGRMWQAYKMALTIDELSWEDILDWQLDWTGWGMLQQLDSFAEAMDGISIVDLVGLVTSGENSIGDVRTAMRMAVRYDDADLYEALARIAGGASNGEINQFYRLAQELDFTPEKMDEYLASGASLTELRHAWKYAERVGAEFDGILEAHVAGNSWGEIKQAIRLADELTNAEEILVIGIQEYRKLLREQGREESRLELDNRMALKLADHFGFKEVDVWIQFGSCEGNWGCVRKALREQAQFETEGSREQSTAARIAKQYDKSESEVMAQYDLCNSDWSCVRAFYREASKAERGKGNN